MHHKDRMQAFCGKQTFGYTCFDNMALIIGMPNLALNMFLCELFESSNGFRWQPPSNLHWHYEHVLALHTLHPRDTSILRVQSSAKHQRGKGLWMPRYSTCNQKDLLAPWRYALQDHLHFGPQYQNTFYQKDNLVIWLAWLHTLDNADLLGSSVVQ